MKLLNTGLLGAGTLAIALVGGISLVSHAANPVNLDITFVNHIQANLPEQDVFIEGEKPDEVIRVEGDMANDPGNRAKDAYAAAEATAHDPFKVGANPLGPFKKGEKLGFTLGQWLEATGSGTYTVENDSAQIQFSFQKLVPNGVYTVWCSRITFPPNPNIVDNPCGAPDGSENAFTANGQGNASFSLSLPPLPESTKETASIIALAYHSDGKTYGSDPGAFGKSSHVQIFSLLPVPEETTEVTPTPTPPTPTALATSLQGISTTWIIVIILIILVVAVWLFRSKGSSEA